MLHFSLKMQIKLLDNLNMRNSYNHLSHEFSHSGNHELSSLITLYNYCHNGCLVEKKRMIILLQVDY